MPAPQSSPHQQHTAKYKRLVIGLIALVVLLAGVVAAWFWLVRPNPKAEIQLAEAVKVTEPKDSTITLTSQLGFGVTYNTAFVDTNGQVITSSKDGVVGGEAYSGDELKTPRSYSIVTLQLKNTATDSAVSTFLQPNLVITTNARKDFFETRRPANPGKSDIQIVIDTFAQPNDVLASHTQEVINGITYEKLVYESRHDDEVIATSIKYLTIQNNRPFAATINYFPRSKQGDLTPLVQALHTITYQPLDANVQYLSRAAPDVVQASTSVQLAADKTVNTPQTLASGTDISVVAKNQLAVVRVGTIYCFDVDLLSTAGKVAKAATNVCTAGSGSGSIVSKDGKVSTNGHVVTIGLREAIITRIELDIVNKDFTDLQGYVDWLVAAGVLSQSNAPRFADALKQADDNALQALQTLLAKVADTRMTIKKQAGEYAIQLSDTPIRLKIDGSKLSFNYGNTIVGADYVDADYDPTAEITESVKSDVALLAIKDKRIFPVVNLGKLDSLSKGDQLTIVGFPGFVDGGVLPKSEHTIPTATQGRVDSVLQDNGGHYLIGSSTPLAEGNSGGPAFNASGEQVGLATYAVLSAADPELGKSKLSKDSYIRDIGDFVALAGKHNLTFDGQSPLNSEWYGAVSSFASGDYPAALGSLKKVDADYAGHYLVANLRTIAQEQVDIATKNLYVTIGLAALALVIVVTIIIWIVRIVRHHANRPQLPQQPFGGYIPGTPPTP